MRKIETEIHIEAPPDVVWRVLVDFGRMDWNPLFRSITGTLAIGEQLKLALRKPRVTLRPRVTKLELGRLLEWRGHFLVSGLLTGRHVFELSPAGAGTHLRHDETFTGMLIPLMAGALAGTKRGFESMNHALKAEAERLRA